MRTFILLFAILGLLPVAWGQPGIPMPDPQRIDAPPEPDAIALYDGPAPGSEGATQQETWFRMFDQTMVRNVTSPTLTPVLPDKDKANGAAVLVIPGGGFQFVSMQNEGWPIAQWLAERGVAAFILKYRLEETPVDEAAFQEALVARFKTPPRAATPSPIVALARADAQAALRLIRADAKRWNIDPNRVGVLGFSAGAMTTMATTLANAPDARPDFIAPIYGFMTAVTPPPNPQPMFAALAADDPLFGKQGFGLIESWMAAGGSVELHVYEGGSHGFGSRKLGTTSDLWFDQFMAWMQARGFLQAGD